MPLGSEPGTMMRAAGLTVRVMGALPVFAGLAPSVMPMVTGEGAAGGGGCR